MVAVRIVHADVVIIEHIANRYCGIKFAHLFRLEDLVDSKFKLVSSHVAMAAVKQISKH